MDGSRSFGLFILSAVALSPTFILGELIFIPIAILILVIALISFYYEDTEKEFRKEITFKKFLSKTFDMGTTWTLITVYALAVLFFSWIGSCDNSYKKPVYPYHNAVTGEGQYEYEGSYESWKDAIDEVYE